MSDRSLSGILAQLAMFLPAAALVTILVSPQVAWGNFAVHGAFSTDTDACAGCHRAHTSISSLTWKDAADNDHSALLISQASTMQEFCLACHGEGGPGAATNVEGGLFDSGPTGELGVPLSDAIRYQTNSSFGATLNAGGFARVGGAGTVTSVHTMEAGAATSPMWGAGLSAPAGVNLTCVSCHDVHGSSNYRILKDAVNGAIVGGYDTSGTPTPFVFSSEQGYPGAGWLKHEPGVAQMALYRPNYTSAEYQWQVPSAYTSGRNRSMTVWCTACHEQYDDAGSALSGSAAYDYGSYEQAANNGVLVGSRGRHRHPVDTPIATVTVLNGWGSDTITSTVLPLDKRPGATEPRGTWTRDDYLGCLTCHVAHGTSVTMTGWANARLVNRPARVPSWTVEPTSALPAGVEPGLSSALLRAPNRGVCERCHNK